MGRSIKTNSIRLNILSYLLGALMIAGAIGHIVAPDFYAPLVPDFIPLVFANVASTIVEGLIGVLLFIPKYRRMGGLGFCLLMIAFLPLHVWDMVKEDPITGPPPGPQIRLVIQLLLIYAGWWIFRKTGQSNQ
jgi:uncharacterized membrane protein